LGTAVSNHGPAGSERGPPTLSGRTFAENSTGTREATALQRSKHVVRAWRVDVASASLEGREEPDRIEGLLEVNSACPRYEVLVVEKLMLE